jgi:hypothetical protein
VNKCEQCGASVDPAALACPYCHLQTRAGAVAAQNQAAADRARQQWVQAVAYQKEQATAMQVMSTATQSIWLSIGGMLLCGCFPLGVVGIVQALRAKAMAEAQKLEVPQRAKIGLYLGILSCVVSVVVIIAAGVSSSNDQKRADARIAELDKQIGSKASGATIDRATACAMAEEATLKTGFDNNAGYQMDKFDCPGRFLPSGDSAQLEDFSFNWNSTNYKVFVCFKHGGKWFVENLSEDPCDVVAGADDGGSHATTAATSTTAPTNSSSQHRTKHVPHAEGSSSAAPSHSAH